jgi:hypothetical protein
MKKIIVLLMFCTLALSAEKIEFFGNYHSDERKTVPSDSYGFVGGCIYNGKTSDGALIKVYTKKACNVIDGKKRIGAAFSCDVATITKKDLTRKKKEDQTYEMYEGFCEVKN